MNDRPEAAAASAGVTPPVPEALPRRVVVFGGNGAVGRLVCAELALRDHDVCAVSRTRATSVDGPYACLQGDMADSATVEGLARVADAVVVAISPRTCSQGNRTFRRTVETAINNLVGTRFILIGGAGTLIRDGRLMASSGQVSERCRVEAGPHIEVLHDLYLSPPFVNWTYLTPPPRITRAPRTGRYLVGRNNPVGDGIGARDLAVALVDEIEEPAHPRERFTVAAAPEPAGGSR